METWTKRVLPDATLGRNHKIIPAGIGGTTTLLEWARNSPTDCRFGLYRKVRDPAWYVIDFNAAMQVGLGGMTIVENTDTVCVYDDRDVAIITTLMKHQNMLMELSSRTVGLRNVNCREDERSYITYTQEKTDVRLPRRCPDHR